MMRARPFERLAPLLGSSLTLAQIKMLLLARTHGEQTIRQLGAALDVTMPTVSVAVDRLVERGLLIRREDPQDRRVRLVRLSEEGEEKVAELEDAGMRFGRTVLEELDIETLRHFARAHTQLAEAMERHLPDGETPGSNGT